jgi:molecular chaperone GrpE
MDAVMTEHVNGIDPNIVIDVMLKGYKYNEKVIRPAMVKVSE